MERPKVASYQSRRMAAMISLLHVVPLAGAFTLLALYWTKSWVGGTSDNATTLQIIAKAHELVMQASIIDVLLYTIRVQALEGFLPFGALAGAAHAPRLSYLWSLDFVSAILSPSYSVWRKIMFALSVSVLTLITATVGPSSAILIIPRPGLPHRSHPTTRYLNTSEAGLFPDYIDRTQNLTFNDYETVKKMEQRKGSVSASESQNQLQYFVPDISKKAQRVTLHLDLRVSQTNTSAGNWSIMSMPTMLSSLQLQNYGSIPGNWILETTQPVVMVSCTLNNSTDKIQYFPRNGSPRILPNAADLYAKLLNKTGLPDNPDIHPSHWLSMPDDPTSLLGLFYLTHGTAPPDVMTCIVSPFWWTVKTSFCASNMGDVIQTEWPQINMLTTKANLRPITIDVEGVAALYSIDFSKWMWSTSDLDAAVSMQALFLAELARYPGRSIESELGIDHDLVIGQSEPSKGRSSSSMFFKVESCVLGFGYGSTQVSFQLAVAVIVTYCVVTLTYLTYINVTGHTSLAWNSATELIMLALQSRNPGDLGHISVGLDSMETFRKNVGIRVATVSVGETGETEERLELVFEHDKENEKKGLKKLERNKAY